MRVEIQTPSGPAVAEIDRPREPARALLVLTHGAGGGVDSADINAVRSAALTAGIAVVRLVQPYRVAGRRSPAAPAKQDEAWLAAVASGAVGVVALAFPLHPPGRPENTRLPELDVAGVPVLVVQGDRDPFGMPPAGPTREVVVIAGADHSLKRELQVVAGTVTAFVTTLVERAKVQT